MATQINRTNQPFEFQGFEFTYAKLKEMKKIYIYIENSQRDRFLLRDDESKIMFLYEFTAIDSNELYVKVESENDADRLSLDVVIKRIPFIQVNSEFEITIYE